MARNTDPHLQNQIIYSVFIRNFTKEGTFRAAVPQLPRIRALGADIVWLMPVHPIGSVNRKGSLGSPYAIRDYRSINPEYGTMEDFLDFVRAVHENGMKCIIDVVFNHTSPDSVLWNTHPEFFLRNEEGLPAPRVPEWSDIIDLDYSNRELWENQIGTLLYWAQFVDGFRCDVASFVPVEFWLEARRRTAAMRAENGLPELIWLAETVHRSFGEQARRSGMYCAEDAAVFEAFDIEYEYDIREEFEQFLRGEVPLSRYLSRLNEQERIYPANYNKLRFLENHDVPRIASFAKDGGWDLRALTAMLFFLKGTTLLYNGQETCCSHLPGLFDRDPVDYGEQPGGAEFPSYLARLAGIKKSFLSPDDSFTAEAAEDTAVMVRENGDRRMIGVFPLRGRSFDVPVPCPDGVYEDFFSGKEIAGKDGRIRCAGQSVLIRCPAGGA